MESCTEGCNCTTPTDVEEKQWRIELATLEIEKLKLEVTKAQAEAESAKAKSSCGSHVHMTCSYCNSELTLDKVSDDYAEGMVEKFLDVHDPCGRR